MIRGLPIIFFLVLTCASTYAQKSLQNAKTRETNTEQAQLQLSTRVIEQRYSVETGSKLLHLMLELTYSNTGDRPILLDKKSSLVYRTLLSSSLKAALKKKYDYDEHSSLIGVRSMQASGMRLESSPYREDFVIVQSGESYSLKTNLMLKLYDGTKETEDFLHPGTRFLQLRVATWYYFADPVVYREQWRDDGYLWSQNITSLPMPLTVKQFQ